MFMGNRATRIALIVIGVLIVVLFKYNANRTELIQDLQDNVSSQKLSIDIYKKQIQDHQVELINYQHATQILTVESEQRRIEYEKLLSEMGDCYFSVELTDRLYQHINQVRANAMPKNITNINSISDNSVPRSRLSCKNAFIYIEKLITIVDNQNNKLKAIGNLQ